MATANKTTTEKAHAAWLRAQRHFDRLVRELHCGGNVAQARIDRAFKREQELQTIYVWSVETDRNLAVIAAERGQQA